jgi:hypothetical protein
MRRQQTQRDGAKGNQPTIAVFRDAYQFSNEGPAHIDELPTPFDLSIGTHPSHLCQRRVLNISKLFRIRSRRGHIQTSRWYLAQGLVRSHCVIYREEVIAPLLLCLGIGRWWFHNLLLEGTMYPFMPAVLLRVSWLDALRHNSQLDPPHGQRRQSTSAYRGERRAVVSADSQRQAVFPKNALKNRTYMGIIRLGENLAAQEHAGAGIADGQGITADSVTGADPTLEISAPHAIRSIDAQEWLEPGACAPAALAPCHQPMQTQNPTASAHSRPCSGYLRSFVWAGGELGGTPGRMSLLGPYHRQHNLPWRGLGTPMRSAGALVKPRNAFIGKAAQPLIYRFPTHPEVFSQLRYSGVGCQ